MEGIACIKVNLVLAVDDVERQKRQFTAHVITRVTLGPLSLHNASCNADYADH